MRINDDYSISSYEVMERVCSLLTYFFSVKNKMVGFGSFNTNDIVNLIMALFCHAVEESALST